MAHWARGGVLPPAGAQPLLSFVLQRRPGSLIADPASCPVARRPAPAPPPAATPPGALAAPGAPGALAGAGAGAGARAKGQDGNAERWGLGTENLRVEDEG